MLGTSTPMQVVVAELFVVVKLVVVGVNTVLVGGVGTGWCRRSHRRSPVSEFNVPARSF